MPEYGKKKRGLPIFDNPPTIIDFNIIKLCDTGDTRRHMRTEVNSVSPILLKSSHR